MKGDQGIQGIQGEAGTPATAIKLDDMLAPDDNTDLNATASLHGLMGKADKSKLDGIAAGADVTGAANVAAAGAVMNSLLTERGSIIYRNATVPAELLHGNDGQVLTSKGHAADPIWADAVGGVTAAQLHYVQILAWVRI